MANNFNYDFKISLKDSIPLDPSSCNKILCRRSLHEFTEPSKMLKEIRRVLKDSGEVVIIEALPKRKGIRDDYCGLPYLMPDEIIKMWQGVCAGSQVLRSIRPAIALGAGHGSRLQFFNVPGPNPAR